MWVYAVDAKASVEALPAAHGLRKRVPLRWYARAVREALAAGRKSAHARRAPHMFDTGAAGEALATFAADHAPGDAAIRPDASDWEIVEKARRIAADVQLAMHGIEIGDALVVARSRCDLYGVAMPAADDGDGQVARVRCELWWRRRLRTQHGRNAEASSVRLGLVHYGGDPYASREAVARRMGQNARNRLMLESVVVENDEGYRATLAELADKGTAN
ncbi:replication endonuclease, partial [Burkholderia sp.]